ncbi:deuterolysin metalloprotease [Colletotrichum tofieldiae]|uniref:Neutral protease 2 n=1 Tax=Colletotrichum tofieldiae TaxID=708197 RepID=A0A161W4R5_9PEZI|nr:deuterolysin metalloprotease [Colletotrichum tofieldiae]GKT62923.1 deuterolysin metalloprotease [Colletotrichum tofieldiae]GKT89088.1 deuterolysin metalloprotease [Colletotrichum tofieldiae]
MKFFTGLTLLASLVSASPFDIVKRDEPLQAKLIRGSGNTLVKIALTNSGKSAIKLFTPGTILDKAAVEKVAVYSNQTRLAFDGVRLRIAPPELITDDAFQTIKRGQTVEIKFDFGQMHDLGDGGVFELMVNGGIPYAKADTTEIAGTIPINSNTLKIKDVDAKKAALTRMAFHQSIKRTVVQSDCKGDQNKTVNLALITCARLARQAANATKDDARMMEYFKDASAAAKKNVTDVFKKVSVECNSRRQGVSMQYCGDVYKSCSPGVLAYTVPALNYMVNCPLYFTALPPLTTTCHGQDQATTTLHEMTHLLQMKGTLDYGVYGYDAVKTLPGNENLNHADTYCLFANAINIGKTC